MSAQGRAQGRVVWHDLNTTDLDASKRFYGELFGWRFDSEGGWTFLYAGEERDHFGAVMTLDRARGLPSHWLPYVAVDDLDAAMGAVGRAGGKLHLGKTPAGKSGNFAVAADGHPQRGAVLHHARPDHGRDRGPRTQ
jgi:predicted enzyme related to lactoylglutathione lyase